MRERRFLCLAMVSGMLLLQPIWAHSVPYRSENTTVWVVNDDGQRVTLDLKDVTVKQLFDAIHKQTGMDFMYNTEQLSSVPNITVKAKNEPVADVLMRIFGDTDFTFRIDGKMVTITKKGAVKAGTQARKLKGTVFDKMHIPVIGAAVMIKGTHTGVTTDMDGNYELEVKPGEVLSFTYLGMEPKEMTYDGRMSKLNIIMEESSKTTLSDVVVTGIFKKAKESYTGAVSTVTKEQIDMFRGQNLLQTLKNIDASLNFSIDNLNGSNPNNIPSLNIRGTASLPMDVEEFNQSNKNNPNTPLIIMDGFEISLTKLMDYNDEEIESINILKDAAATAIYGSRGANGVIVVISKKPEPGKLKVNLEMGVSFDIPDLSSYNLLDAAGKLEVERRAGLYERNPQIETEGNEYELFLKENYNKRLKAVLSGVNTDWIKKPLRTGVGSKYNLRLEGGGDEFRWAATASYNNTQGAMKGSERRTFNGSITLMYQLSNLIFRNYSSLGLNRAQESKYGSLSNYTMQQPYNTPYNENGELVRFFEPFNKNGEQTQNPLYDASLNSFDKSSYQELTNNFSIEWNILKELTLRAQLGLSKIDNTSDYFLPSEHSYFTTGQYKSEYGTSDGVSRRGLYRYGNGKNFSYDANITLSYNKIFKEVHSLYAGFDWSVRESQYDGFNIALEGFANEDFNSIGNALQYAKNEMPSGNNTLARQFGITGNINYTYDNRYYLDLSYRVDGNSDNGSDKKFAPFYSVGIGWNMHREKFLMGHPVINTLRLKMSYGETGSATNASATDAYTMYRYINGNRYMNWIGASLYGWGNPDLSWQTTQTFNAGIEFGLWENRLKGSFDVYTKETSNLLSSIDIPWSTGFNSYKDNIGEVRNFGWEAGLSGYVIRDREHDFNWMLSGQLVYNRNKITKLSEAVKKQTEIFMQKASETKYDIYGRPSTVAVNDVQKLFYEGAPQNAIYAVRSLGIDPSTGREIYLDKNGKITETWNAGDKVCLGSSDPLYRGNFNSMFQWKDLTLNLSFGYYWGGKTYNETLKDKVEVTSSSLQTQNVDERVLTNRWYQAGDVVFFKKLSNESTRSTSRYVMDDNVLELQSISLQYKWKSDKLRKLANLNTIILGVNMSNIYHWGSIKMERGIDYTYARTIQGSIKFLF